MPGTESLSSIAEVPSAQAGRSPAHLSYTRVRASSPWQWIDLRELWNYRELLWILAWRDVRVRYKQAYLGAAWAILQPLLTVMVFYALFRLMNNTLPSSPGIPYIVTTFAAMVIWQFFATSLTAAGESLIANQGLLKKVYFPRLIIPLTPVVAGLVDFAVAFVLLLGMMAAFRVQVSWNLLAVPACVLLAALTALAAGLWLSALSAMYRDFRYTIPFLTQIWLFTTPVVYDTATVIPAQWQWLYFLNPMAGVVEGFRWSLFGTSHVHVQGLAISVIAVLILLGSGLFFFKNLERTVADWV